MRGPLRESERIRVCGSAPSPAPNSEFPACRVALSPQAGRGAPRRPAIAASVRDSILGVHSKRHRLLITGKITSWRSRGGGFAFGVNAATKRPVRNNKREQAAADFLHGNKPKRPAR